MADACGNLHSETHNVIDGFGDATLSVIVGTVFLSVCELRRGQVPDIVGTARREPRGWRCMRGAVCIGWADCTQSAESLLIWHYRQFPVGI